MLETQLCVSARCDQCGDQCWQDWDYRPHWPSEPAARAELAERDWQLREDRMVCARCAALETCRTHGHQFSAWRSCLCGPGGDRCAGPDGEVLSGELVSEEDYRRLNPQGSCPVHRWCERCWHFEEHPGPASSQGVA